MTATLTGYDRAEAEWLSQPENRLTNDGCDLCNQEICACDELTDEYRDRFVEGL